MVKSAWNYSNEDRKEHGLRLDGYWFRFPFSKNKKFTVTLLITEEEEELRRAEIKRLINPHTDEKVIVEYNQRKLFAKFLYPEVKFGPAGYHKELDFTDWNVIHDMVLVILKRLGELIETTGTNPKIEQNLSDLNKTTLAFLNNDKEHVLNVCEKLINCIKEK